MNKFSVLWIDDEIDQLKAHLIFLESRNFSVRTCVSGRDALNILKSDNFDIILLDENMPGLSGLETLFEIGKVNPKIPVIMITRNEEESIMDEAIGAKISDYLIKPVNPNQILSSLKKNLDNSRLITEKTTSNYQQEFNAISLALTEANDAESWIALYKRILYWEIQLDSIDDSNLKQILESQKSEANRAFGKFIERQYPNWIKGIDPPVLSHSVFKSLVFPNIQHKDTLFLVIDNLRFDQWLALEECLAPLYRKIYESAYFSILPTATQYARNAIFSGLTPLEMQRQHPEYWRNDNNPDGKNQFEEQFLLTQINRLGVDLSFEYHKISNTQQGKQLINKLKAGVTSNLLAVVYNFVDMLSHAKTEMEVIKELAPTDKAYRSLTRSWFKNSPLLELIIEAKNQGLQLIVTTDHGTINVNQPSKVVGDKETSSNLRYKTGRSLSYEKKEVVACQNPEEWQLPSLNMSSSFIFAKNNIFLAYPNNFNRYVNFYRNTYQHGGISLEEMVLPFIVLAPK
jgi:CheY-like chemotaxis protein